MAARKKKKSLWKWLLLALVLGGGGFAFWKSKQGTPPVPVTLTAAEKRNLTSTVSATGKIFPLVEVKISSEVAGEIVELPVKEGQEVKKGDLLARVNPDTLLAQVKREEATIQGAKARADQNRASLDQAKRDYLRLEDLYGQEFVSADELERAQTRLKELEAATAAAMAQIDQTEMQLSEARDKLGKASVFAPMDGTVSVLSAELGERVVGTGQFAGTEIMRVADLSTMEVRVEVTETDIVNINLGDKVRVEVDALPEDKFAGTVSEIATSARITNERTSEQSTTFQVRVKIDDLDPRIRPGMTATAEIETETVTEVVSVPLQAVTVRDKESVAKALGEEVEKKAETGGEGAPGGGEGDRRRGGGGFSAADRREARERTDRIVFVVADGVAKIRRVQTGVADSAHIEIKSGLEAGEKVVSGSYSAITRQLNHDTKVTEEKDEKKGKNGQGGKGPGNG